MIGSLANYSNTIPSAPDGTTDGDAKPAQPAARMGKSIKSSARQMLDSTIDEKPRKMPKKQTRWTSDTKQAHVPPHLTFFRMEKNQSNQRLVASSANSWSTRDFEFKSIQIRILNLSFLLAPFSPNRHTHWMFFAMYPEHFRCDIVHSFDMGRWNGWRHLRFRYRPDMLLCGEYHRLISPFCTLRRLFSLICQSTALHWAVKPMENTRLNSSTRLLA
jgi:hypothetical protein